MTRACRGWDRGCRAPRRCRPSWWRGNPAQRTVSARPPGRPPHRHIGLAVAGRLAADGFDLTVSARSAATLDPVAASLFGTGIRVEAVAADMGVEEDVRALAGERADGGGMCCGRRSAGHLWCLPHQLVQPFARRRCRRCRDRRDGATRCGSRRAPAGRCAHLLVESSEHAKQAALLGPRMRTPGEKSPISGPPSPNTACPVSAAC
jgi:hypothetical protein